MYRVENTNNGWALFFEDRYGKEFIANQLSKKQAEKWCKRLNQAFDKGCASCY